ncbi:MAG: hypothetical protein LUG12_11225 [Erysipelotrichaceae bacterium]|nr:hypothetical protein [Erysipelotrichaceae bacterium]
MALFDDFTKKAAKVTEEAIDKTQELASTAKLKLKIKNLETDRDDVYCKLGQYYFELIKNNDNLGDDVKENCQKIVELTNQIEELKQQLDEA